jgi:uncharacterized membrane protein YbaN (DUF454 family)
MTPDLPPPAAPSRAVSARAARIWRGLGTASVAVGLFNAFIPLLPTTIFLIIGAWAYGKGSPELRAKLLADPTFGPALTNWVEQRAMTRIAKWQCIGTIITGYVITLGFVGFTTVSVLIGAGLAGLCLFLSLRPEPTRCPVSRSAASPRR